MLDIKQLRKKVRNQRDIIFSSHRDGAGGLDIVGRLTSLADDTIKEILDRITMDDPSLQTKKALAFVGVGGYGRGELSPWSDIDLLTLHESGVARSAEKPVNTLIAALWDIGFEVGHVFCGIRDAIDMSGRDMTVKNNLIHNRLIWGNTSLYSKFEGAMWKNTVKKNIGPFLTYLEDMRMATAKSPLGITQPNVKYDTGGLRSLQTSLWAAFARFGIHNPRQLQQRGILTRHDVDSLYKSLDFLLRVRNELHFREEKANDTLAFEIQENVAHALGYEGNGHLTVVRFMKDYYLSVSELKEISDGLFSRSKNYRKVVLKKPWLLSFKKTKKEISLYGNEIFLSGYNPSMLQENHDVIIEIFELCQKGGYQISQTLRKALRNSLEFTDSGFFSEEKFTRFFVSALKGKRSTPILRIMHECGVMEKILPEFNLITHTVPYDFYHAYTIEEHTFQALSHLEELAEEKSGILSEIFRGMKDVWIVKLALLLHDIGKPEDDGSRNHAQISANIAERVCRTLRLAEKETGLVIFLIKHHILLNFTARRRDTQDSGTIHRLANTIRDRKRLDMLYLITYADMKGVAPGVWSNWFAFLLEGLYERTADFINIDEWDRPGDEEKVAAATKKVFKYIPNEISEEFAALFMSNASTRYLVSVPAQNIIDHIVLASTRKDQEPVVDIYYNESRCTEMVILSQSHRGNLNRVSGILSSRGINILEVRIFKKKDGTSIDIFRFNDKYGKPVTDKDQIDRIKNEIVRVMWKKAPPRKGSSRRRAKAPASISAPAIEIKNNISPTHTVIEIEADDRIGLIQSITYALFKMGFNIHLSKIDTEGTRAIDALYVTDEDDLKVTKPDMVKDTIKALMEVL